MWYRTWGVINVRRAGELAEPTAPSRCAPNTKLLAPPRTTCAAVPRGRLTLNRLAPPPIRTVAVPRGRGSDSSDSVTPPVISNAETQSSIRRRLFGDWLLDELTIAGGASDLSIERR